MTDYITEPDSTLINLFLERLQEISRSGFTLEEFENALLILCFLRFIIYSIKYNPITSFKICCGLYILFPLEYGFKRLHWCLLSRYEYASASSERI